MPLDISQAQTKRLILNLQGLARPPAAKLSDDSLFGLIEQMGFVQIDTIRWVERAQHMILFSRNQHYLPEQTKRLIESQRTLFENYTHDASLIPTKFYQYWKHRFRRSQQRIQDNFCKWQGDGFLNHCEPVIEMIREHGPVKSRDIKRASQTGSGAMWQWDDAKTALEYLWRIGTLGISARDGFEKVYDLQENIFSPDTLEQECSEEEFIHWSCQSALQRLGVGSAADIAGYWNHVSISEVRQWLKQQDESSIIQIRVPGTNQPKSLYGCGGIETVLEGCAKLPNRLRVMSPFDPVIRDRNRLQWLFDFQYRIEIYVPESKRKYGYYVFPLLDGERLVGRIDMRAARDNDALEVEQIWFEDGINISAAMRKRLDQELQRHCQFAGVSQVRRNEKATS